VDAEGSAGGDAFGSRRAGRADLIGGSGTAPFAWYTNRMRDEIKDRLNAATCAKSARDRCPRHRVGRWAREADQAHSSTGNQRLDECFDKALASITT